MCFGKEIANVEVFFLGLGTYIKGIYQTSLKKCLFGSPKHYLYSLFKQKRHQHPCLKQHQPYHETSVGYIEPIVFYYNSLENMNRVVQMMVLWTFNIQIYKWLSFVHAFWVEIKILKIVIIFHLLNVLGKDVFHCFCSVFFSALAYVITLLLTFISISLANVLILILLIFCFYCKTKVFTQFHYLMHECWESQVIG